MSYNIFLQKFGQGNHFRNFTINDRYNKRIYTLNQNSNKDNHKNIINNKTISGKNLKSFSISEAIKKIENLKKKYNKLSLQKQINEKNIYKKILKLKGKYLNDKNKTTKTENNLNIINNYQVKKVNSYTIENTDKIAMINKSWNKKPIYNLMLNSTNNIGDELDSFLNNNKVKLQKSNEINYQINSELKNNKVNKIRLNLINSYKNYYDKNNKNIRNEFLYLDKKINLLLKDDDEVNDNEDDNDNDDYLNKNKRNKSVCPIKDRIILLTDVKKKIKRINKDLYEENDKTQNSSVDSDITLGFSHIKPVIKKENFYEEYLKEDEPKKENETISKPILIRSLPRPKLNVPNYPSFFHK